MTDTSAEAPTAAAATPVQDGARPQAPTEAANSRPSGRSQPVLRAFALGWHMAELCRGTALGMVDLPVLADFDEKDVVVLRLRQIRDGLKQLTNGAPPGDIAATLAPLDEHTANEAHDAIAEQASVLHKAVLIGLTVIDPRLGKSYGLGKALAETCLLPHHVDAEHRQQVIAEQFQHERLIGMYNAIADLKSDMPDHVAYAVASSLYHWELLFREWDGSHADTVHLDLLRQGQIWYALVCGDKRAQDLLKASDFVEAAARLFFRFTALGQRVLPTIAPLLMAGLGALVVVVILVALALDGTAAVWAGALAVLASAAGAWSSVSSTVGSVIARAQQPLWDSELDESIAVATTHVPAWADRIVTQTPDLTGLLPFQDDFQSPLRT